MSVYDFFSKYDEVYDINDIRLDRGQDLSTFTDEEKPVYEMIMNIISLGVPRSAK